MRSILIKKHVELTSLLFVYFICVLCNDISARTTLGDVAAFSMPSLHTNTEPIATQIEQDSIMQLKQLAFANVQSNHPIDACKYIHRYVMASLDVSFVDHSYFTSIQDVPAYQQLQRKYLKKINFWGIFCLYVSGIGFFIAVMLNLRKKADRIANCLMSIFVWMHSFFIFHISLRLTNYMYELPHSVYMSTVFSFLYGPLIYFYFKRVTTQYRFKPIDVLHVLPTVVLLMLLIPVYLLPAEEKMKIIIHNQYPYIKFISFTKLTLLLIYGGLMVRMYLQMRQKNNKLTNEMMLWQRNIVIVCSVYILSYAGYIFFITQYKYGGYLYYVQIIAMGVLVLYVGYTAFIQPSIFGNVWSTPEIAADKKHQDEEVSKKIKYEKSGLTPALATELLERLLYLLDVEKVYKQNDITLQKLSSLLDTSRHNTSQIINENFGLNFFELMNKYRIEEAKKLLKAGEKGKKYTIIDIAYEVGFNNKVTFNKSFKKYNHSTPSEYIKSFI